MSKPRQLLDPLVPLLFVIIASLLLKGAYGGPFINKDGTTVPLIARCWLLSHCIVLLPFQQYILLGTKSWGNDKDASTNSSRAKRYKLVSWVYIVASIAIEFSLQTIVFPKTVELSQIIRDAYTGTLILGIIIVLISGGGGGIRVSYPTWMQWHQRTNFVQHSAQETEVDDHLKVMSNPLEE